MIQKLKIIRYALEAALLWLMTGIFKILGPDRASAFGGWIGRSIGPRLAASRKARRNLERAMPELTRVGQDALIRDMWDNLGRLMAEYPHLETIARERVIFEDPDGLTEQMRDDGKPGFMAGGHLGNWEVAAPAFYLQKGIRFDLIYREPNNPWTAKMLTKYRGVGGMIRTIPKAVSGTRRLIKLMKNGGHIGLLNDQKYNPGLPVPFFGSPAMTSPAFIQLAQKFSCPVVLTQVSRTGKACRFKITVHRLMDLFDADGNPLPVEDLLEEYHAALEDWIREDPGQWLWLHRRWSEKAERLYAEKTQGPVK